VHTGKENAESLVMASMKSGLECFEIGMLVEDTVRSLKVVP